MSGSKDLPGQTLPNELWIRVLERASRPTSIIGDEACLPDEIEYSVKMREYHKSANALRQLSQHNKKRLRAVCRLWREVIDNMKEIEWCLDLKQQFNRRIMVVDFTGDPKKARFIPRLNILVRASGPARVKNYHPTSALTLVMDCSDDFTLPSGLSLFIADPASLRSLHLTIDGFHPNNSLLATLTEPNIQLVTLSLKTSEHSFLNSPLVFPFLITLSLNILPGSGSPSEGLRTTSWSLPSLTNLSLNVPLGGKLIRDFVSGLLRHHSTQLRSLRVVNVVNSGLDMASPSFWTGLPRLEVLATAFHLFMCDRAGAPLGFPFKETQLREALIRAWPVSLSLRHLIQNDDSSPDQFILAFAHVIKYCPKLDTVSLCPSEAYDCDGPTTEKRIDAIRKLQEICASRAVRILNAEGSAMVDMGEILKVYSKGPFDPDQTDDVVFR